MSSHKTFFASFLVFFIICMVVLPKGLALKCFTCNDPESCKKPEEKPCLKQGRFPAADRCWVHRETAVVNGTRMVVKDKRSCLHAYQCLSAFHCDKSNNESVQCEAGCCEGDLCNHHGFKPSEPTYSKPNGADLSCYSCSDLPKNVLAQNLPAEATKCSNPSKRKCGVSKLHSDIIQDRCITLDVEITLPHDEKKKMQYRTCADMSFCANSNEAWGFILNDQMGTSPKVRASCCTGNLCGNGHVIGPITGLTSLACLAVLLITYWIE